jgi:hypothetical protein
MEGRNIVWMVVKYLLSNKYKIILTFKVKPKGDLKIPTLGKELTKPFPFLN